MSKSNKYVCAFADTKMSIASNRLRMQAKKMKVYDDVFIVNETTLDKSFINQFKDKFSLKGFGYWCWKPQIILQAFSQMNDGDIVQYTDVGCHLNKEGISRLNQYFNLVEAGDSDFLVFEIPNEIDKNWCKGDLLDFFEVRNNPEFIDTPHIWAGAFFVKKTKNSQKILEEWLNIFIDHFNLADDSQSFSSNHIGFKGHQHDQSIFSLLAKKHKFEILHHRENTKYFADYPILALRDTGNTSKLSDMMSQPKILRVLIHESRFIDKVRYIVEIILGQRITQFINNILK